MCGFSVIIDRAGAPVREHDLTRMNDAVAHRGPDAAGVAVFGSIGLGHRRLSILDLTTAGDQPMTRAHGTLVYNGEIYNFQEIRAELQALGVRFRTSCDTEVLLEALNMWWVDALPRLNGMFAFAYLDHREDRLLLARDRFGIKPLFWTEHKGCILAGSEIKQAFATGATPMLDEASASAFLFDAALNRGDASFFAGVRHLPGGHYAIYERAANRFEVRCWYDLRARVQPIDPGYGEAREQVSALLRDSMRLHHIADVPLGACLSGGIDSSAICSVSAGIVADPSDFTVFTAYHDHPDFDERNYSRLVVEKFGFRSIELLPDLGQLFEGGLMRELGWYQDQPLLSGSHFNEYLIFKAARERGVTVILDGQGSDEYFGGYGEFWFASQVEALRALDVPRFREGIATRAQATGSSASRTLSLFVASLLRRSSRSEPEWVSDGRARHRGTRPPAPGTVYRDLAIDELVSSSLPYQLHSEDRNSMRWSIEARLPMLDHRLVEYALSLPTDHKIGAGYQKRVLRDAVPELPAPIARRRSKMGFVSADVEYFLNASVATRSLVTEAAARLNGRVNSSLILEDFDAIVARKRPYHDGLFRLISLVSWADAFGVTL